MDIQFRTRPIKFRGFRTWKFQAPKMITQTMSDIDVFISSKADVFILLLSPDTPNFVELLI